MSKNNMQSYLIRFVYLHVKLQLMIKQAVENNKFYFMRRKI